MYQNVVGGRFIPMGAGAWARAPQAASVRHCADPQPQAARLTASLGAFFLGTCPCRSAVARQAEASAKPKNLPPQHKAVPRCLHMSTRPPHAHLLLPHPWVRERRRDLCAARCSAQAHRGLCGALPQLRPGAQRVAARGPSATGARVLTFAPRSCPRRRRSWASAARTGTPWQVACRCPCLASPSR